MLVPAAATLPVVVSDRRTTINVVISGPTTGRTAGLYTITASAYNPNLTGDLSYTVGTNGGVWLGLGYGDY